MSDAVHRAATGPSATEPRRRAQPVLAWLALAILAAGAVVGSNTVSIRDRLLGTALPAAVAPATSRVAGQQLTGRTLEPTALRSTPWWQTVTTAEGAGGPAAVPFTIGPEAIQWRVTWSCTTGHLLVRGPGQPQPLVDAPCPQGTGFADRRGPTTLEVAADGPWHLEVAQRIDTPLVEPPLPSMTAAGTTTAATGAFYKVDRVGSGRVSIYDQADGGYSVRLEDFWVTPNASLQLRLSTAAAPHMTQEYLDSRSQLLAVLDVTAGSLSYAAPVGVDPSEFRSLVVWSSSDNSVYAAARLEPPS